MDTPQQPVVRLSLRWIIIGAIAILAIGFLGGLIGVSVNTPQIPLTPQGDRLITTVQEVTVSPDKNIEAIVSGAERSVLLLASGTRTNPTIFATASVVTNDGLLVSMHPSTRGDIFAIDNSGTFIDLETVGQDAVYGVTFYRIRDGVLPALELATSNPTVGVDVSALSRSSLTTKPIARTYSLESYILPPQGSPLAWHRLGSLHESVNTLPGTPLLLDDGKVAGITAGQDSATVIPITYIRRSLERLASGDREANPFEELGFTVTPTFAPNEEGTQISFSFVVTTTTNTPNGLRTGDSIISINEQELTWEANIVDLLSVNQPLIVEVQRRGTRQTIPLTPGT